MCFLSTSCLYHLFHYLPIAAEIILSVVCRRELEDLRAVERCFNDDVNARSQLAAAESKIQSLERQLVQSVEQQRLTVSDLEASFKEREGELLGKLRQQDLRVEEMREERVRNVKSLERQLEQECGDHKNVVREWESALATSRQQCEHDIQDLRQLNEEKRRELESNVDRLEDELRQVLALV